MALTFSEVTNSRAVWGDRQRVLFDVTFDSSYAAGGESATPADFGFQTIDSVRQVDTTVTGRVRYDSTNEKLQYFLTTPVYPVTGTVTDDDSATSNGTDVVIAPLAAGSNLAYLESTNAGNADAVFQIGASGPSVVINDNDSPASDELYFDEDGSGRSKFLHDMSVAKDVYIPTDWPGVYLLVAYDASASTNGVACHFDDDASNAYERLLFVSPTDADGSFTTDDGEAPASAPISGVTVRVEVIGDGR